MTIDWKTEFPWSHETPDTVPLVVVHWRDITTIAAWGEDETIGPYRKLQTAGWFLYEGPDPEEPEVTITIIAGTYDGEEKRWADYYIFPQTILRQVSNEKNSSRYSESSAGILGGSTITFPEKVYHSTGTNIK